MTKIFLAVDVNDVDTAKELIGQVHNHVDGVKLGLEFFISCGQPGVRDIKAFTDLPIFLDLKLHDIPSTVAKAVRQIADMEIWGTSLHGWGGEDMFDAARVSLSKINSDLKLLGVIVLTSHDDNALGKITPFLEQGVSFKAVEAYSKSITLAIKYHVDGIICSGHELDLLSEHKLMTIVPGVVASVAKKRDQKRISTPKQLGGRADYIVVGRDITESDDPQIAAEYFQAKLLQGEQEYAEKMREKEKENSNGP